MTDREVMQQALEALRSVQDRRPNDETNNAIAALRKRLAQPEQEPVAWSFEARHIDTAWGLAVSLKHPGQEHKYLRNVKPLYTAPPQRRPLTEEEIGRFCDEVYWSPRQLVRAVERAHGIKE